jgi:hypothetical protein
VVLFFIGLEQTSVVFVAGVSSYMVVCGSGLFAAIASRGVARKKQLSPDEQDPLSVIPKKKVYIEEK